MGWGGGGGGIICGSKWSESQGMPVMHEINPYNISGVPEKHLEIGLHLAAPLQYAIKPTDNTAPWPVKYAAFFPSRPSLIIYITTM